MASTAPAFYLSTEQVEHMIYVNGGATGAATGQPAYVSGLTGLLFFYRTRTEKTPYFSNLVDHILTEARTGLIVASAHSRSMLHQQVRDKVARHGLEGFQKQIEKFAREEATMVYMLACSRPRRNKAR